MKNKLNVDVYISILKRKELLSSSQLKDLVGQSKEIFMSEPNMVQVPAPVTVVGDIHGQFYDLLEIFKVTGEPPFTNLLFLGDYVDRGVHSIECLCLILSLKVKFKEQVTVLRGNHESRDINKIYGFYEECFKKYGTEEVWKLFTDLFTYIPLCGLVQSKIFCLHGGLSPGLQTLE